MKRKTVFILAAAAVLLLSGCGKEAADEPVKVYSFNGSDEYMEITDGVLVLHDEKDIFYGGHLKIRDDEKNEIISYTTEYYVESGNEKKVIMSGSVTDPSGVYTGEKIDLGRISGDGIIQGSSAEEETGDNLKNNLYFSITAEDRSGKETVHKIQLKATDISSESWK